MRIAKGSDKDKPSWDWTQVQCSLKINESSRKNVVWNLAPTIILTNPTTQCSDPNVRLYIDTQKSLQYSYELGWNWHKSWNLPNISLRLEIKDENTEELLLAPKNLYAQMFAVKKNCDSDRSDHMSLIDVGIRGQSKMQMIDSQVYFSAMKFSSTTYNNEGMNFNLLIVLYISEDGNEKPKILTAVISPGIFVDSRRSARDYQQKKFNSFIEPFLYENLEKQYIKRQSKSKTQSQIVIKNDPEGFYNYLTAPNIRHKVKHPIFLAIKFSNCVQILYNTEIFSDTNTKSLIENLQKKLLKESKGRPKTQNGFVDNPNTKTFIFLVQNMNDSLKKKKVMQSIQTMENTTIGILYDRKELNSNFENIGDPDALINAYRQSYQNLIEQCRKYQPSDSESESFEEEEEEEQEEEEEEEEQFSERSIKKVKLNQNHRAVTRNSSNIGKKSTRKNGFDKVLMKKQQDNNYLEEPKFFPPALNQIGSKKSSAFNRAVGFKFISPQNSQNLENKNSDNPTYTANKTDSIRLIHSINQLDPNNGINSQMQNKGLENLISNNLMLSSWLSNVKNNNVNLYDSRAGSNAIDQLLTQNTLDRFNNRNQSRNDASYQVNEQLQYLMQQVNIYRELLAQITYQNHLLGTRMFPQNLNSSNQQQPPNYPPDMLHSMFNSIPGINPLAIGLGMPQFSSSLGSLGGFAGLSGLGLGGLGSNSSIQSLGSQGLTPGNLGTQNLSPQAMGINSSLSSAVGVSGLLPNLQNLQTLQALQSLGGLINPGFLTGMQSSQLSNLNLSNLNGVSKSQTKQQQKGSRDEKC